MGYKLGKGAWGGISEYGNGERIDSGEHVNEYDGYVGYEVWLVEEVRETGLWWAPHSISWTTTHFGEHPIQLQHHGFMNH